MPAHPDRVRRNYQPIVFRTFRELAADEEWSLTTQVNVLLDFVYDQRHEARLMAFVNRSKINTSNDRE